MSWGLECWDGSKNSILNVSDRITRLRYSKTVPAGSSGSVTLSDISGKDTAEIGTPAQANSWQVSHHVYRSGDTINWDARSAPDIASGDTLILVFIYT